MRFDGRVVSHFLRIAAQGGIGLESQQLLDLNKRRHLSTTTCPNCMMVWLAPGLQDGDTYECKICRRSFVVRRPKEKISPLFDQLFAGTSEAFDQEQ